MKTLTKPQQAKLREHSKHHTAKHMREMRTAMSQGASFSAAHAAAKRKVGK